LEYVSVWARSRSTCLPEAESTWPRPGEPNWDLRDLAGMTRPMTHLAETLEDLAETTGIWPMADPYHGNLADGRRPTPTTVNAQTKISEVNPSLRIR